MTNSRFVTLISLSLLIFVADVISAYAHNNAATHPDITHAMNLVRAKDEQQSEPDTGQVGDFSRVKYQEVQDYRGII